MGISSGSGIAGGSTGDSVMRDYSYSGGGVTTTEYIAGFYDLQAADLNLSQASATGTHGAANVPYGAHAILVAGGVGAASGGTGGTADITVSGTSVTSAGVRQAGDTEVIVTDVTDAAQMAADTYHETVKKWVGTVTYTIAATDDHTTFSADFNVGFTKYDDFSNRDTRITGFEVVGIAGAADAAFNVTLIEHSASNWTYHATAFVAPTANDIANMNTDYSTEQDLDADVPFAYKRTGLSSSIFGASAAPTTSASNGFLVKVDTGAANAVGSMDVHINGIYI